MCHGRYPLDTRAPGFLRTDVPAEPAAPARPGRTVTKECAMPGSTHRRGPRRGPVLAAAVSLVCGALTALGPAAQAAAAGRPAGHAAAAAVASSVSVQATAGLGTIPAGAVGLNTAVYDQYMTDPSIPSLVKAAGIDAMRYPGGSYSDIYDWQTNTAAGGYDAPDTSFDDFMATAGAAGASPIVTVNYGTGTPALAAAWVRDADVTHSYGVTYWEVGNEVYGNGFYGSQWETDDHSNKSPDTYAANFLQFQSAMKAADPDIKVCAVLTTPGFWPDGVVGTGDSADWNHTVLSTIGSGLDCAIVHYYPGGSSPAAMLTDPGDISGIVSTLHAEIARYAGSAASGAKIIVTETNSSVAMDTQPGALFAADMYMTWLENGVVNVDWWNEHNGVGTPSTVGGVTDYGDQGMFSNASNGSGVTEPAVDTPFAPYYGVEMLSRLGSPGDEMVTASSSNALLKVHAVRRAGGGLDVLLDNEDPSDADTVSLSYSGFTASGSPTVSTFGNNATSITSASGSASSVTVPAYSLVVLQIPGSGGTGVTVPGAPGQPVVSNLTSSGATLTWPASTAGSSPVADYKVYRQSGTSSTLVATTAATTLNLSGLTVGDSYTYNVIALDAQGNQSLPSPPVTFTVPAPANSPCAVHYTVTSTWPGGFGAAVTITNRAASATASWTLSWTWPAAGESVSSGWNGTYTQTGQSVTVANATWNGAIAANGGTASLGFNGADTGQAPAPTVFELDGTVCSDD